MSRAMYAYTKTVLKKVSFNTELFCKELEKAIKSLLPYEINELRIWLHEFAHEKPELNGCLLLIKEV